MNRKAILVVILLSVSIAYGVEADDTHTIKVVPQETNVIVGENFTVSINIVPASPISAAMCNITFDPAILQAEEVMDGGMFDLWLGNLPGVAEIDNINGTISYISAAASEGRTSEGTFAIIKFRAIAVGSSSINIEDPIIQRETNVNIINGVVNVLAGGDTNPPEITNIAVKPFVQYVNGYVNISASIYDESAIDSVKAIIEYPNGSIYEYPMSKDTKYYLNRTYSMAGTYHFRIYARDEYGNENESSIYSFEIVEGDNVPPEIKDVLASPSLQDAGKDVTISCKVTDNIAVKDVFLNITYPDGTNYNFSIKNNKTDSIYYCNKAYNMLGTYSFFIFAIDDYGNKNKSQTYEFEIDDLSPPQIENINYSNLKEVGSNLNISCKVTDNIAVKDVFLNITYPDGTNYNFSIKNNKTDSIYYCNKAYNMLGTYSFFIFAIDDYGNKNKSQTYEFEIDDTTPPVVGIIYPKGGEIVGGKVIIKWNATDNYGKSLLITIKYSPNNGATWHLIVSDTENDGEYEWDTSKLESGDSYLISVSAKDAAGNIGKDVSDKFTVDNTHPTLAIQKPKAGRLYIFDREIMPLVGNKAIIIGKITIVAEAQDQPAGIEKVEFYIDGSLKAEDNSTPYEWIWDERTIGKHTIKVIAYDKAGNKETREVEVLVINPL